MERLQKDLDLIEDKNNEIPQEITSDSLVPLPAEIDSETFYSENCVAASTEKRKIPLSPSARFHFWTPLLLTCAWVVPFFFFIMVSNCIQNVPGLPGLVLEVTSTGPKIYLRESSLVSFGFVALVPSLTGVFLAAVLMSEKKPSARARVVIWILTMILVAIIVFSRASEIN